MMALDQAYRGPETAVRTGSEIAFFPPVSGG
jgi:molybdopterin converting factor small subunit